MDKKLVGIFICMLLIGTIIPVAGTIDQTEFKTTSMDDIDWWPKFQHDSENTGYSTSTAPNFKNILWTFTSNEGGFTDPIVVDDKVLIGSMGYFKNKFQGKLYCLDANSGSLLWTFTPLGNYAIYESPTVAEGKVFLGVGNWDNLISDKLVDLGDIYCLDINDGRLVWEYDGEIYVEGGVNVVEGKVYVGGCTSDHLGLVLCLDAETGEEIWSSNAGNNFIRDPICVANNNIYFCTSNGNKVFCLNALDGTEKWQYNTFASANSAPTVVNGKVFFGCQGYGQSSGQPDDPGVLYCLDAETGAEIWTHDTYINEFIDSSSPAIFGNSIFIGTTGKSKYSGLRCFDKSDGSVIWSRPLIGVVIESPAVADGKVFISTLFGYGYYCLGAFYCLDISTGLVLWRHFVFGQVPYFSTPAIANGKVYVGLSTGTGLFKQKGTLFCFS